MTDTYEAEYRADVEAGKAACAIMSGKQWVLGDLALKVEKKYGENRLKQFAEDINFHGSHCTLERYRPVCRAFPKTGPRPRFFGSAKILVKHPDCIAIVERNPDISKREARQIMRQWREASSPTQTDQAEDQTDDDDLEEGDTEPTTATPDQPADDVKEDDTEPTSGATTSTPAKGAKANGAKNRAMKPRERPDEEQAKLKETRRVFNIVVVLANDGIAAVADVMEEDRSDLLKVVEPRLVEEVRKGGEALIALADSLDETLEEAAEAEMREDHVKTSPKPASASVQAQA